jgi:hypothetical protein
MVQPKWSCDRRGGGQNRPLAARNMHSVGRSTSPDHSQNAWPRCTNIWLTASFAMAQPLRYSRVWNTGTPPWSWVPGARPWAISVATATLLPYAREPCCRGRGPHAAGPLWSVMGALVIAGCELGCLATPKSQGMPRQGIREFHDLAQTQTPGGALRILSANLSR